MIHLRDGWMDLSHMFEVKTRNEYLKETKLLDEIPLDKYGRDPGTKKRGFAELVKHQRSSLSVTPEF